MIWKKEIIITRILQNNTEVVDIYDIVRNPSTNIYSLVLLDSVKFGLLE